jgi:uncharacterized membrane protein
MRDLSQALLNLALSVRAEAERRAMIEYLDGAIGLGEFWQRMDGVDERLTALTGKK